jgi:uncharacterized protein (DUF2147 family)
VKLSKFPAAVTFIALATVLPVPSAAPAATPPAKDVIGIWVNDDGEGAVAIEPCGDKDKRCGRIIWLKTPLDKAGHPLHDANNPDPAARQRPICGIEVLKDLVLQRDGSWDDGSVYDPEEGKVYSVMLRTQNDDRLEVRGYIGLKALGESVIWTRAPAQLKPCLPATTSKPK